MPVIQAADIFTHKNDDDFLGSGSYGAVYRCYHSKIGKIAVKLLKLHGSTVEIEKTKIDIQNEADILTLTARSEYVINFLGTVKFGWFVGLLMEYAPRGDLQMLIGNQSVPWLLRLRVSHETASGIAYLHSIYKESRITHSDLKPGNILLGMDYNVKICDFQGAKLAFRTSKVKDKEMRAETTVYTANYASPEFLRGNSPRQTRAMDVYSFAMVLYFILTGKHPFQNLCREMIIYRVGKGERPNYNSEEIKKVLSRTENQVFETIEIEMKTSWNLDPSERPEVSAIKDTLCSVLETFSADVSAAVNEMKAAVPIKQESVEDERITLMEKYPQNYPYTFEVNPYIVAKATCSTPSRFKKAIDMSQEDDFLVDVGDEICIITKNGTYTANVKSKH